MVPRSRLDERSRRALLECGARFAFVSAIAVVPCVFGLRSWHDTGKLLATLYSLGSFIAFIRAARSGDRLESSSVTLWDEAMAFSACSLFVHGVMRSQV